MALKDSNPLFRHHSDAMNENTHPRRSSLDGIKPWFKKAGWIYYPISWQGIIVTIFLLLFLANIFIVANARVHSVSDLLYAIFPFWVPAILVWLWIGSKSSSV